jgi:PAS domain S-box-containing protein
VNGTVLYWIGVNFDIDERKRSEAYLAEAQKLSHTGSWVWNVEDRGAVHLSDEWYRIYGFDPAEGPPDWEGRLARVHPEDRSKWAGTIEKAILDKADYDVDFRIVLPDGKLKWIYTAGHPVLTSGGDLVQFLGSSTDITERKQVEDKLKDQDREIRQMLDFAPQLVAVYGPNRERLHANRIALDYVGLSLEEWRQTTQRFAFVHPRETGIILIVRFLRDRATSWSYGCVRAMEAIAGFWLVRTLFAMTVVRSGVGISRVSISRIANEPKRSSNERILLCEKSLTKRRCSRRSSALRSLCARCCPRSAKWRLQTQQFLFWAKPVQAKS